MKPLKDWVAVVAGATRGAGRGIARGLGEAGATVYCTGRSVRGKRSSYKRPETIEETAELVTEAGGTGIAVRVDHTVEADVRRLFTRIKKKHKHVDVLVNSVAGEDPTLPWHQPLVKIDLEAGLTLMRQFVFSHLLTVKHAVPVMTGRRNRLIVEVTEGDTLMGSSSGWKVIPKLFAFLLAQELRKQRIAVLSVTPGFLRSESILEHFGVTELNWRDGGKKDPNFLESESPLLIGRCVAALAADKTVMNRAGDVTSSWELAREYGVADADGRRPDWEAHWKKIMPQYPGFQDAFQRECQWLDRIARRAEKYAGEEPVKN